MPFVTGCIIGLLLLGGMHPAKAQESDAALYVAVLETQGYVVGQANSASGLQRYEADTLWTHLGWRNVRAFGLAAASADTLFLAAGNGVFRSPDGGTSWRITTGWRVTEVLDVAVDPHTPEQVYAATAYGVWRSADGGETWQEANTGIPAPASTFTQTIVVDHRRGGHVLAGGEGGLFQSEDGGMTWAPTGPHGVVVRAVAQHPSIPDLWLAGTEDRGVLLSRDGGHTWQFAAGQIAQETLYALAFDPDDPERIAVGGYQTGVYFSEDGGASWTQHRSGLPEAPIHALHFDPNRPARLWAGTMGAGVFYSDDFGQQWQYAGLAGAAIRAIMFVEAAP